MPGGSHDARTGSAPASLAFPKPVQHERVDPRSWSYACAARTAVDAVYHHHRGTQIVILSGT